MDKYKKSPQERYAHADKNRQHLRDKRAKLNKEDPNYEKKINRINEKIHKQNVQIEIAKYELQNPAKVTKKTTVKTTIEINGKKEKSYHSHFHFIHKKK